MVPLRLAESYSSFLWRDLSMGAAPSILADVTCEEIAEADGASIEQVRARPVAIARRAWNSRPVAIHPCIAMCYNTP